MTLHRRVDARALMIAALTIGAACLSACESKPSARSLCEKHDHEGCVPWMKHYIETYSWSAHHDPFDSRDELIFSTGLNDACFREKVMEYCLIKADAHTRGSYGIGLDKTQAVETYEFACGHGEREACLAASELYMSEESSGGIGPAPEKAHAVLEVGCKKGYQEACLASFDLYMNEESRGDLGAAPKEARAVLEMGCDEENPSGATDVCSKLGVTLRASEDEADAARGERLRLAICNAGGLSATNSQALGCLELMR